jgi:serine protease
VADDLPLSEVREPPTAIGEEYVPDEIIVKFKEGILSAAERALNESLETTVVHTSPRAGFKVLMIPAGKTVAEMVDIYSQQPMVEYAEPNYIDRITFTPNDTWYSEQWNFAQIGMSAAWDLDTASPLYGGDPSIIVAVIDTGVAYENYDENGDSTDDYLQAPDLANTNFWVNSGEIAGNSTDDDSNGYTDDINGWDFVNSDAHPNDDDSHGTHVTGTIAQSTNNNLAVAGIAFNTTIMPLKTLGTGGGTHAQLSDAYHYAADNGAHIINYSAGGGHSTTKENAVAYARNAGVIIMAAMGNDGDDTNVTEYPAAYNAYVIAVGATDYLQARASYSSYGSHNDIAAPGGDAGADNSGYGSDGILQNTFNPITSDPTDLSYWYFDGTSMATPHVSGVAALILAENPTWTGEQVRHALQSTANDLGTTGKDDEYGWGLLDAPDAIGASLPTAASYKDADGDTVPETPWETFSDYDTEHIVYISSAGLLPSSNYRMAYYDSTNAKRDTQNDTSDASGDLTTQHTFIDGTDQPGTWRVIVSDQLHTPPVTYSSSWTYTLAEDTFTVQSSAIPEFPTALAAMAALSLSAGIYLWMRRKAHPVPA